MPPSVGWMSASRARAVAAGMRGVVAMGQSFALPIGQQTKTIVASAAPAVVALTQHDHERRETE
jgi:hypothetical protein